MGTKKVAATVSKCKKGKKGKKVKDKDFEFSDTDDESQDERGYKAFFKEDDFRKKEIKKRELIERLAKGKKDKKDKRRKLERIVEKDAA